MKNEEVGILLQAVIENLCKEKPDLAAAGYFIGVLKEKFIPFVIPNQNQNKDVQNERKDEL